MKDYGMRKSVLMDVILRELEYAENKFPPFHNFHEGYAVLKEEVDELWDEIKGDQNQEDLFMEAVQVAAMAMRFCLDTIRHDVEVKV